MANFKENFKMLFLIFHCCVSRTIYCKYEKVFLSDMQRFFLLLKHIPRGLTFSSKTEAYLASISLALIIKHVEAKAPPPKVSINLISELIVMHQKYTGVVGHCFENNPLFLNVIDNQWQKQNESCKGHHWMIVYY